MNAKFHPAIKAVRSDDLETFKALVAKDPSLATSGSTQSHPTLLQCVVLDGNGQPNNVEMARVLIEAGAELDGPLVAAGSIDNKAAAELLLDHGAAVDRELEPQLWSLDQPDFAERLAALQTKITSN